MNGLDQVAHILDRLPHAVHLSADSIGCGGRILRELLDLVRDNREAVALLPGARGLDGRIEREEVCPL